MKMKTIRPVFLLLLAGMATVSSCDQEQNGLISVTEADNLLQIETAITETRAVVTGTSFQEGDNISVIVPGNDNLSIRTVLQNEKWSLSEAVALTDAETYVYATYPYNEEIVLKTVTANGMAMQTYQQDIDISYHAENGQNDYMYGVSTETVSMSNPTAYIEFKHALARITLSLIKDRDDVGNGVVSKVVLQNRSANDADAVIHTQGTLIVNTYTQKGYISAKHDITAKIEVPTECNLSSTLSPQTIDLLVIPTTINEDAEIILTIDGSPYSFTLPASTWEAGEQYTYNIFIDRKTLITPTITPGEKIYLGFNGDNGQPLYWSSYNLGATSPEDYGGLYGWGDPTGEKTSTDLDDYPSANPPSDINDTEYNLAKKMWGDGWRLPSNNEMWRLLSNCDDQWTTINGREGILYTSKTNGNSIFIPTAPVRTGESIVQGTKSYYWLNTLNQDDNSLAATFHIDTYWENDWPTAGEKRYLGLPIRPVTEEP